jgi:tetratricopeptide (TPR) repeat protein
LGEQNLEVVARHLVMVLQCLEDAPELAYRHARAAAERAGRVAVIREYAGLTSYFTDRYAEAVRELRTYQRISGERHYSAILADALRGIGKPEEALEAVAAARGFQLEPEEVAEIAIVEAGAHADLKEFGAARVTLDRALRTQADPLLRQRIVEARAVIEAEAAKGAEEQ